MSTTEATIEATSTEGFVGPCGDCACEKYADCAYCGTCIERDPWAAADAEANADAQWDRKNAVSLADFMYGEED